MDSPQSLRGELGPPSTSISEFCPPNLWENAFPLISFVFFGAPHRILVPGSIDPSPRQSEHRVLTTGPPGNSHTFPLSLAITGN